MLRNLTGFWLPRHVMDPANLWYLQIDGSLENIWLNGSMVSVRGSFMCSACVPIVNSGSQASVRKIEPSPPPPKK